jgi:hypothetical protein
MGCSRAAQPDNTSVETVSEFTEEENWHQDWERLPRYVH